MSAAALVPPTISSLVSRSSNLVMPVRVPGDADAHLVVGAADPGELGAVELRLLGAEQRIEAGAAADDAEAPCRPWARRCRASWRGAGCRRLPCSSARRWDCRECACRCSGRSAARRRRSRRRRCSRSSGRRSCPCRSRPGSGRAPAMRGQQEREAREREAAQTHDVLIRMSVPSPIEVVARGCRTGSSARVRANLARHARTVAATRDRASRGSLVQSAQKPGAFSSWSCQSKPISLMMRLLITMMRDSLVAKL